MEGALGDEELVDLVREGKGEAERPGQVCAAAAGGADGPIRQQAEDEVLEEVGDAAEDFVAEEGEEAEIAGGAGAAGQAEPLRYPAVGVGVGGEGEDEGHPEQEGEVAEGCVSWGLLVPTDAPRGCCAIVRSF